MEIEKTLVIIGASGHGRVVADIAKKKGYSNILFFDDNSLLTECGGYPVIGTSSEICRYKDSDFIVAIGNASIRQKLIEQIQKMKIRLVTLVHPNTVIGENTSLGDGTVVMAGVVINPGSRIGRGCIINTCASVDHDCVIGNYAHVSVGAHIAGTVMIGDRTWIGAGATVSNNIEIVGDCMIGAGAVVINNIRDSATYVGVPARKIKMENIRKMER